MEEKELVVETSKTDQLWCEVTDKLKSWPPEVFREFLDTLNVKTIEEFQRMVSISEPHAITVRALTLLTMRELSLKFFLKNKELEELNG
jgi:hypothetical protein